MDERRGEREGEEGIGRGGKERGGGRRKVGSDDEGGGNGSGDWGNCMVGVRSDCGSYGGVGGEGEEEGRED